MTNQDVTCTKVREELPLLAIGALPADETAQIERHLGSCSGCQLEFEAHRGVFELVQRESSPSVLLDSERILREMKKRLREESRVGYEPVAPVSPRSRKFWILGLALVALGMWLLVADPSRPEISGPETQLTPPERRIPLAKAQTLSGAAALDVFEGEAWHGSQGAVISFVHGVDLRLGASANIRFRSRDSVIAEAGPLAVYVPPRHGGFTVLAGGLSVRVTHQDQAVRFVFEDGKDLAAQTSHLSVLSGTVTVSDPHGVSRLLRRNEVAEISKDARLGPVRLEDTSESHYWIFGSRASYALSLEALERPAEGPWPAVFRIENSGSLASPVAGYHPLGVNYQLEIRKAGQEESTFVKMAPRVLRKRSGTESPQPAQETTGQVMLLPNQAYELELDLRTLLPEPGVYVLSALYLDFERSDETGQQDTWSFTLKSAPVQVTVPEPKQ